MTAPPSISPEDRYPRRRVAAAGTELSFIDTGTGAPVVFLHGNPTSSYLWRNVIPHVEDMGRCLAPDLVGMGDSGRAPDGQYGFFDHARYLDAWFEAAEVGGDICLVMHDWGSGLGFDWARRHPDKVRALVYMEALVCPLSWDDWPASAQSIFKALRSPAGDELVLEKNLFVERILPAAMVQDLSAKAHDIYRRPYLAGGEVRRPTLTWPRMLPIDGEPPDVTAAVAGYSAWLATSPLPKLFINADPGSILTGRQRELCRRWPNQQEVTVPGGHFIPEDSPHEIGAAIGRFLASL